MVKSNISIYKFANFYIDFYISIQILDFTINNLDFT